MNRATLSLRWKRFRRNRRAATPPWGANFPNPARDSPWRASPSTPQAPAGSNDGNYASGTFSTGFPIPVPPNKMLVAFAKSGFSATLTGNYRDGKTTIAMPAFSGVGSSQRFSGHDFASVTPSAGDANIAWFTIPDAPVTPFDQPFLGGLTGPNIVTVGNVGSGAIFTSADQTAFNTAVSSGATEIWILPGTTIKPTAACLITGTGGGVIRFLGNAKIQLQAGVTFTVPASPGGANSRTNIVVVGSATNWKIYDMNVDSLNSANGSISGLWVGGLSSHITFYNYRATNCTLWARQVSGYTEAPRGTPFDGAVDDIVFVHPTSDSCGNAVTPDGGGMKHSNFSSVAGALVTNIIEYEPEDTNVGFTAFDINWSAAAATNTNGGSGIRRFGGKATSSAASIAAANGNLIFIEAGAIPSQDVEIYGGFYDGVTATAGCTGVTIGSNCRNVKLVGVQVANLGVGFAIAGSAQVNVGGEVYLEDCYSRGCITGMTTNVSASGNAVGSWFGPVYITGMVADDYSTGLMTTGLSIGLGTQFKLYRGLMFRDCDFSRIASGGTILNMNSNSGPFLPESMFVNCKGITDKGAVATALGTSTLNEIRSQGGSSATALASTTYRIRADMVVITQADSANSNNNIVALSPAGNTLGKMQNAGASATPTASIDYVMTLAGGAVTTSTGGTGVSINVTTPDGRPLAINQPTITGLLIPQFSIVNFGAFTVAPTVTSGGMVTPFTDTTAAHTLTTQPFPYNSSINLGAFTGAAGATTATSQGGGTITSPFFRYRELSILGATGTVTANIPYEAQLMNYYLGTSAGGTALQINDAGGAIVGTNAGTTFTIPVALPRLWEFICTAAPTLQVTRANY